MKTAMQVQIDELLKGHIPAFRLAFNDAMFYSEGAVRLVIGEDGDVRITRIDPEEGWAPKDRTKK